MAVFAPPHMTNKGLWAISVGFVLVNGKRSQKKHWLGKDHWTARRIAQALQVAWENETATSGGKKVWTPENIRAAFDSIKQVAVQPVPMPQPQLNAVQVVPSVPYFAPPTPSSLTLPDAIKEYRTWFLSKTDVGDKHRKSTGEYLDSVVSRLEQVKLHGMKGTEVMVGSVGMEWLDAIRNYITSRPTSKVTHKPLSTTTVMHWLMALRGAFIWFDKTPRIGWRIPHPTWLEKFALTAKQKFAMQTDEERDSEGRPMPCYTVEQLAGIYRNTTRMGRRYILMGLLLGWSQEAVSSFRKPHFVKVGDDYFIERRRHKTGVPAGWWVAPELAAMLAEAMQNTPPNPHDLAFLTEDGHGLCEKSDSIRLTWERALSTAPTGTPVYSFGKVKKTGAQLVENLGSHDLTQLFLAHSSRTVAAKHYAGSAVNVGIECGKSPYEKLHDVQRLIWSKLKPLFFPAPKVQQQTEGVAA